MTAFIIQGTPDPASVARPQIYLSKLAGFVGQFVARQVGLRMKIRKDRRHLQHLSDHMLADLGLSRSDIE